jgi:hypothetical protein
MRSSIKSGSTDPGKDHNYQKKDPLKQLDDAFWDL